MPILVGQVLPSVWITLGDIVNLKLKIFPARLKEAVMHLLLKKPSLDPTVLLSYHLVSNLPPFMGKVIERVVTEQLQAFLDDKDVMLHQQKSLNPWKNSTRT